MIEEEEKTLGYVATFCHHQKNFGWQMKLTGKLSSGRNFSETLTSHMALWSAKKVLAAST